MNLRHKSVVILALFFLGSACELEETNINPNDPTDVPVSVLLPGAQEETAELMAEEAAVIAGIFCQYFVGVDNRATTVEAYLLDESFNMNPIWQDFYNGPLNVLSTIIEQAEAEGARHYAGLAKVLLALNLGTVSSLWGDVPYQDAFDPERTLSPAYDPQEAVYSQLQQLLDEAIEDLNAESSISPGDDDVIYQGDLARWERTAYALKARFFMHTIKRDGQAAEKALENISKGFQAVGDGLVYPFGFTEAELNPWYQYFRNTPYIEVDPYFSELLEDLEDPRKDAYIRRSFGIERVGSYFASEGSPVPIMTYADQKMLEAEALLRTGQAGAEAALQAGVRAHIQEVTGGIAENELQAYLDNHASLSGSQEEQLRIIVLQQYIAHYTQVEGWTDFRRTGYPELQPNEGGDNPQNPGGAIPRRFVYPQNESLYNENFPAEKPNLQDRFWWDQ